MNKFYIIAALSILASASASAKKYPAEFVKLQEAIKAHDAPKVKSIMRTVDKLAMAAQDKKQMLEDLQKQAIEAAVKSKNPWSYVKNVGDSWKTLLGAVLIGLGVYTVTNSAQLAEDNIKALRKIIADSQAKGTPLPDVCRKFVGFTEEQWSERQALTKNVCSGFGAIGILLGAIPAYYGLKASNQKAVIEQAEDIEHFVSNKLEDLHNPGAAIKDAVEEEEEL